jgi:hypothetical protein
VHDEKMGKSASIQLKGVVLATSSVPRPRVLLLILVQQAEVDDAIAHHSTGRIDLRGIAFNRLRFHALVSNYVMERFRLKCLRLATGTIVAGIGSVDSLLHVPTRLLRMLNLFNITLVYFSSSSSLP